MGYLPIFLYLFGFILLFVLVTNNSLKNKKKQYQIVLEYFVDQLKIHSVTFAGEALSLENLNLKEAERQYLLIKSASGQSDRENTDQLGKLKVLLGKVRKQQYDYNKMITTKPYSFVARIFGHHSI